MRRTIAALVVVATTGCATVANDQREKIPVRSDPPGAVVSVDCGNAPIYGGLTPAVIIIERTAEPCSVTVAKEGFSEKTIDLQRQVSRATAGNAVTGVITGTLFGLLAVLGDSSMVGEAAEDGYRLGEGAANAIDFKTGAAWKHVPGEIVVKLDPLP